MQRPQMQWLPWTGETLMPDIAGWPSGRTREAALADTVLVALRERREAPTTRKTDQDMNYLDWLR